jgi:hypothetical protein
MKKPKTSILATAVPLKFFLLLLAPLAVLTSSARAQRAGAPAHASAPHSHSSSASFALNRSPYRSGSRRLSPLVSPYSSLPFSFFGDSFDPSDIYSSGYPVASQPPPFLMEALRSMAGPAADPMGPAMNLMGARESSSSEPLMIELQNGRYVRVKRSAADGEAAPIATLSDNSQSAKLQSAKLTPGRAARRAASTAAATVALTASPAAQLPAAVLIFRDGHREEVRDYSIADGALYARCDFYTDGYWNKRIDLANLDVAQTLQANLDRNVKFVLPASPNEVITRP